MTSEVKALLFDVFGTVVDWRSGVIRDIEAVARAAGVGIDAGDFADAWRAGYRPAMDLVRRGELPWTNLDDLHRRTLDGLLSEFGLTGLDESQREWLNTCWHRLDPWPDATTGLERLRTRFVVASLSNGNVSLLVEMARRAGLQWDFVFSAELFRHYKPDPETYLGAAGLLGLAPNQVMLVAAHHSDLRAAAELGLATAFVARPSEYGPVPPDGTRPRHEYTCAATDFTDLAAELGT